MRHEHDYVIVGGGMVADAAAKGIRERDGEGSIAIVGEETTAPFPRPALSKKLWTDADFSEADAALDTVSETGAELFLDSPVVALDRDAKVVRTADDEFGYGTLLLATGGSPRQLETLAPGDRVVYYRTLADYQRVRALTEGSPRALVVGGGYIGSEIAAALTQNGCSVEMVFPEPALLSQMLPEVLVRQVEKRFVDAGVKLRAGTTVTGGRTAADVVTVDLDDHSSVEADLVVVGLGVTPNGSLAGDAGLELGSDGGIVVDTHLRTMDPAVLAAGDVAEYPDKIIGRRRVEHVDNADMMGAAVGRIMAGSDETYDHTPMFYSDLFDLGYEAVGTLDASLETVVVDKGEGNAVVYYRDGGAIVGVLLWGVWDSTDAARDVLAHHQHVTSFDDLI